MPMYDFECQACQHRWEQMAKMGEIPACPECSAATVEKLLSFGAYKAQVPSSGSIEAKAIRKIDGSVVPATSTTHGRMKIKDP